MYLERFTRNQKTILSIDFAREGTCMQRCPYCYVDTMERIYPAYLGKVKRNNETAIKDPKGFAKKLNEEYMKLRKSKSKETKRIEKLPVRTYGSGDFIPEHLLFLKELNFKIFLISKNLVSKKMRSYIDKVLEIDNVTKIILSFDSQNMKNYEGVKQYLNHDRINFGFTGMPSDFQDWKEAGYKFDVFFNIGNKKVDKEEASLHKEACPVDAGTMKLQKACSYCNKCWGSLN